MTHAYVRYDSFMCVQAADARQSQKLAVARVARQDAAQVCCSVLPCVVLRCIAVCRSVSQCVAVCCSVLQCVAVCCSMLQCVAVCCSVLQCVAVCCSVLQCVAVCCSMLQCVAVCCRLPVRMLRRCFCSVLQWVVFQVCCVAVCCNVLQHVVVAMVACQEHVCICVYICIYI